MAKIKTIAVALLLLFSVSAVSADLKSAATSVAQNKSDKLLNEIEAAYANTADKMTLVRDDAFVTKLRKVISRGDASSATLISKYKDLVYTAQLKGDIKASLDKMSKNVLESEDGKNAIDSYYAMSDIAIGQKVPDFTLATPDGKQVNLYTFIKGKKCVLIDFWASWCGWCRKETPNIKKVYEEYKDKGFDVVGVSFDNKRDAWLKALGEEDTSWTQVCDLLGMKNSKVARWYGLTSIPAIMLVSADGTLLAKGLRQDAIGKAVDKHTK